MKALSLWQPWASAIACGLKRIETRHWSTKYRGPLAIAATKSTPASHRDFLDSVDSFSRWKFARAGIESTADLPRSAIVCTCVLYDCVEMTADWIETLSGVEREWGIYTPGRFAWLLKEVRRLPSPVPVPRCGRTLWEWRQ